MLTEEPQPSAAPEPTPASAPVPFARRYAWWFVGLGLLILSAIIVRAAHSRPGYDPYGWMIWGYQTLHGHLDLSGAPSWKPMPLLFTAPYALFGHYQLWLWMTTAVFLSLAGSIFAGRIAFHVVDNDGANRVPAIIAAIFAGLMPYVIYDSTHYEYIHYILSSQSDPPLVTFVLAAIDMHLMGKRRWAIAALTMASLGRPEAWPAEFLYAIFCLRQDRQMLRFLIGNLVIILFAWFGIPEITNHKPLLAGDLAADSPRMLHSNKIIGTIGRYKALNQWPVWLCAGIATAWAAFRYRRKDPDPKGRNLFMLVLFSQCVLWVLVEIVFALKGLPGVPRYMFEPGITAIVIAAIGLGWILSEIPQVLKLPRLAGVAVAVAVIGFIVPGALAHLRTEHKEFNAEKLRTAEISRLAGIIQSTGGVDHLTACGEPVMTNVEYASIFGWLMHRNTDQIGYKEQYELRLKSPTVHLYPLHNGWASWAWHSKPSNAAACAADYDRLFVATPSHPDGVLAVNHTPPTVLKPSLKHK